ncbi:DUF4381 family protein [Luteimonas viscosa]|uniref:DUF4381 family protein n=1 Tax=Luteimonas viscosa TaxID=1132694 RepID=A0A5D4XX65_9GAMM|nr:DUF4381 family protein [Luteimonas viscosa]TYT27510.1 DUF4381 family protein [Luteimonas viscosa]
MTPVELPLRDVHAPVAPPWWPPAPGWWIVGAGLLVVVVALAWWSLRRRHRRRAAERLFDEAVSSAPTLPARVAAMSELLRRAARRVDADAATRAGDDWLQLLDRGMPNAVFTDGPGALLRDGAFRADVDAEAVEALRMVARARFLEWMERRG